MNYNKKRKREKKIPFNCRRIIHILPIDSVAKNITATRV